MPGMYHKGDYDLAGFAVGAVERGEILPRADIAIGDVLIGLPSAGVHSNGYSLVRRLAEKEKIAWGDAAPWAPGTTFGEALLTPTRIYVKSVLARSKPRAGASDGAVKGLSHITGGGLSENLPRVLPIRSLRWLIFLRLRCRRVRVACQGRRLTMPRCCARSTAASAWW